MAARDQTMEKKGIDLAMFPPEHQPNLQLAVDDPNQLSLWTITNLVHIIMEHVVEDIRNSKTGAKLCIAIIEKDKKQDFLESLINICQKWYRKRDKILRGFRAGNETRFTAFMLFLTEMCAQLKQHQMKKLENLVLLSVLAKCCQACITCLTSLSETENLLLILTTIGRDLESELPLQLEQLMNCVRDRFLTGPVAVRRTFLELIEIYASNWALPESANK